MKWRSGAIREVRRRLLEGEAASQGNQWKLGENLEVLERPLRAESPAAPNWALVAAGLGALGLLFGFTLVWYREVSGEAIGTLRQLRAPEAGVDSGLHPAA